MKYLNSYNELNSSTYRNAARKLAELGHKDRSKELKDWSKKVKIDEDLGRWESNINQYAKFGTYKLNIVSGNKKLTGDFYLTLGFIDGSDDISFFIGIIPTTRDLIDKCENTMPDPSFSNGFYWGMIFSMDYDIEDGRVILKNAEIINMDEDINGIVSIADRASAGRFKTLLKKIFSDPNLNYPSHYRGMESIWEELESVILSQGGLSSDYGFKLEDVANYISKISPNELYRST